MSLKKKKAVEIRERDWWLHKIFVSFRIKCDPFTLNILSKLCNWWHLRLLFSSRISTSEEVCARIFVKKLAVALDISCAETRFLCIPWITQQNLYQINPTRERRIQETRRTNLLMLFDREIHNLSLLIYRSLNVRNNVLRLHRYSAK